MGGFGSGRGGGGPTVESALRLDMVAISQGIADAQDQEWAART